MTEPINADDIATFGSAFPDRKTSYHDDTDIDIFIRFLDKIHNGEKTFKPKPHGIYGIDLGMFDSDKNLEIGFDIERWTSWNTEWPKNYRYVSFLSRKDKFLNQDYDFGMVHFNYDRTKFLITTKTNILKFPPMDRHTKGKSDRVRKVEFGCAMLVGTNLTDRERTLFSNHHETTID